MNGKTFGIDIEADRIAYKHNRDEKKKKYESTGNQSHPFDIGIEKIYQRLLLDDILDIRKSPYPLFNHLKRIC